MFKSQTGFLGRGDGEEMDAAPAQTAPQMARWCIQRFEHPSPTCVSQMTASQAYRGPDRSVICI
jgi:hypothetical protein